MDLIDFENEALAKFVKEITDQIFLYIENDKDLFQKYQRVIGRSSSIDQANSSIGKFIKDYLNLENILKNGKPLECKSPQSNLIKSYTEHCIK